MRPVDGLKQMRAQHTSLRARIELIQGLLASPVIPVKRVAEEVRGLAQDMRIHIHDEEEALPPLLKALGRPGAGHNDEMMVTHRAEHLSMVRGLDDAVDAGTFDVAWTAPLQETLVVLLQHMDHEELQFLNEDVLHDPAPKRVERR